MNPDATETCDGIDQDWDSATDEDVADALTWHADQDADGHDDPSAPVQAWEAPAGHVASADDCDDAEAGINPEAVEECVASDKPAPVCGCGTSAGPSAAWGRVGALLLARRRASPRA